jgi:hypothetical protein
MTYSIEEIAEKIGALPDSLQDEVFDFIEFMQIKAARQTLLAKHDSALTESVSAADRELLEDDEVWLSY